MIVNSPHIVDAIMAYATNSTLAACLRVSKQFHDAAGKVLYHTVRIDESNLWGPFLGALAGLRPTEDACRNLECDCPDPSAPLSYSAFKPPLLARVRILSLGSHHRCLRWVYGEHVSSLLPNVDTLRIVPAPDPGDDDLWPLCDREDECLVFTNLKPRKLVLRNLDNRVYCVNGWPANQQWNVDRLEEVVWVLPSNGDKYGDAGLMNTGMYFPGTTVVKVIFYPSWELWQQAPIPIEATIAPMTPDSIVWPSANWIRRNIVHCTVYGLETVEFEADDEDSLVSTFTEQFPGVQLDSDRLRQLVRDEWKTGALQAAFATARKVENIRPRHIEFKTLEQYSALRQSELYEVDDGLPNHCA
ncbi:hypothetical protein Q8F55_004837 [Vanrija albida]|uniref:F-box domain-containing protein n=1 Tax=Vanrija albida TaxID=181172 RepID=A0ABR3Q007_9TREE